MQIADHIIIIEWRWGGGNGRGGVGGKYIDKNATSWLSMMLVGIM